MSDGPIANFLRDGFARCFAKHAAVPDYAEGAAPAGIVVAACPGTPVNDRAVAATGSDPVFVVAAAPAVAACPGSAAVRAAVQAWRLVLCILPLVVVILIVSSILLRISRSCDCENQTTTLSNS